jgi:two-component system, OmpR family, sensor kinase
MTLRGRLVLLVVAVTLVSLGGAFSAVAAVVNRSELAQLDAVVATQARAEAHRVAGGEPLASREPAGVGEHGLLVRLAAVYDADGRVIDATRSFVSGPPPLALVDRATGEPFDVALCGDATRAVFVAIPGRPGARMLFATPRRDLDAEAAFLRRAMIVAFLVAVAWAGLVAMWVVSRLTRDNDAIAAVVRRVAAGDLSARVGPRGSDREVARLAADVDEMVARLEVLVDSQQRFVAHAAHELRSPLTTLYGELQLALRRSRDAEAYREAIREALDSTERLRSLSEDLLALARAGAEDDADHGLVPLADVARGVAAASRARADARGVAVVVDADAAALARGRRADLERLVRNLVDNAVRHSPPEGTVHVSARTRAFELEVTVADEGEGIPTEARERVFEPFFRLPRDRGVSGAGLGLAIAREIARAHGGDIHLDERGPGARFVLRLPLATA